MPIHIYKFWNPQTKMWKNVEGLFETLELLSRTCVETHNNRIRPHWKLCKSSSTYLKFFKILMWTLNMIYIFLVLDMLRHRKSSHDDFHRSYNNNGNMLHVFEFFFFRIVYWAFWSFVFFFNFLIFYICRTFWGIGDQRCFSLLHQSMNEVFVNEWILKKLWNYRKKNGQKHLWTQYRKLS